MPSVRSAIAAGCASSLAFTLAFVPAVSADARPAKKFKNCTALNKVYHHGVGRKGAHDKTSGTPVTTFKVSTKLYKANVKSDRDKDGIACEKR